ncbi:hypothetical protein [uncultured Sphingomonas sp.]|uniref:hypothetical protein n=1 Tax=uncultured Sphingomonas sp. TaxID=158754 RepID=UPI0035CA24EA
MSARDLARAIMLRWRLELLIALAFGAAALAFALAVPRVSVATATVMIDQRPVEADTGGKDTPAIDMDQLLGAQADLARSARVLDRVARDPAVGADTSLRMRWRRATRGRVSFVEWTMQNLGAQLVVDHDHGSNLLRFQVTAPDPTGAATLANAAARAYIVVQRRIATDPARTYADWYAARIAEARAALEKAQATLVAFQRAHGLVAGQSFDAEGEELQALTGQLALAEGARAESNARAASDGTAAAGAQGNKTLQDLRTALAQQAAKVAELGKRLGPNHPEMIAAQATLTRLREEVAAIQGDVAKSQRIESSGADRRAADLRRLVAAQRARILALQPDRAQFDLLQRDVQSASAAYDAVHARLTAMRLQSEAPRSNVRQLDMAKVPAAAGRTLLVMRVVLGLILGLAVGVTAAVMLEWLDPRVRTSATLAELVAAPVLTALPLRVSGLLPAGDMRTAA